ncbi:hypothetical protein EV426DRAFT_706882 [Tirmania nivea]|nr:hypothetical protein EV426DRAFT_706882 [Tirmania nivea]
MPPSRHSTSAAPSVYQHPQSQAHSAASHGPSLKLTLWIHDNLLSKQEAWLNYDLFPPGTCKPGDLVEVKPAHTSSSARKGNGHGAGEGGASSSAEGRIESGDDEGRGPESRGRGGVTMKRSKSDVGASSKPQVGDGSEGRFLFVVREMEKDLWLKQPKMQISLAHSVANLFGFLSRSSVIVTVVQKELYEASHIELCFRDQYIARSDMWRLATNELSDTCVYKGKKILFVGSLKVQVRHIYVRGQKVQSAYFSSRTKPIFRSESARYVMFIQMSREMWHFDTEGSGEVVFNKLINGFLPELFKRWRRINAHHLVNIVLFTRVVYEQGSARIPTEKENLDGLEGASYKDFFRVVVSNMASTDWTIILHQLKKEFSVFLRDVLIQPVEFTPPGTPRTTHETLSAQVSPTTVIEPPSPEKVQWKPRPTHVIAGRPSDAIHGNILEAINLATSQFSRDFIDRDLVRTGVSVIVITPGTGHFEVDYENLRMTTENLVSNGIGIDLVCLAKMPLHSVPLFKYKNPLVLPSQTSGHDNKGGPEESVMSPPPSAGPYGTSLPGRPGMSPPKTVLSQTPSVEAGEWVYAIPHWIDISFWSSSQQSKASSRQSRNANNGARKKQFVARCKMYELQMMGIMENEISSISIPFLHESPFYEPYKPIVRSRHQQLGISHNSNYSASVRAKEKRDEEKQFEWMDNYDDMVFRPLSEVKDGVAKIKKRRREEQEMRTEDGNTLGPAFVPDREKDRYAQGGSAASIAERRARESRTSTNSQPDLQMPPPPLPPPPSSAQAPGAGSTLGGSFSALRPGRLARHISFGFRGLGGGGTPKAVASTGITTTSVPGPTLVRGFVPESEAATSKEIPKTPVRPGSPNTCGSLVPKGGNSAGESSDSSTAADPHRNWLPRPISILNPANPVPNAVTALEKSQERRKSSVNSLTEIHKDRTQIDILKAASMSRLSAPRLDMTGPGASVPASLSPTSALAPWFSLLNPCNPKKNGTNLLNLYRRWQHVFPRPLRTASVKWKSLCSPAALPLTTEHFPTAEQLRTEYQENPYVISQNEDDDLVRNREELVREMISQRLEQGFQIVVGNAVAEATLYHGGDNNIFDKNYMARAGSSVFMSMGSQIHQLICDLEYNVEVKRYVRKPIAPISEVGTKTTYSKYTPYIRTVLCNEYIPKPIDFRSGSYEYNWNYVDHFIGGYESNFTEQLKFCRSRFLLIPNDPPQSARRTNHPSPLGYSEDSDEEIRLEGIKKLTQLFQRNRHIPPEDRNFEKASKKKDPNPLEILYKTFDPSVVVAQQLESLPLSAEMDASTRRSQLFVGTELFERGNLNLKTLAQEIQGPKGVRLQNRIWHIRLHQKCFIGSELVTWMMENFRDLESRSEAVELGNELMKSGLFHHVEERHPFRDGNYFYQISNEYATNRPSSKGGWFGNRSKPAERSSTFSTAPPPPLSVSDTASPSHSRSRSSTVVHDEPESITTGRDISGPKRKIQLSKAMKYDVDPKKQSYRPEIITLHYDRLHNPDNCYHIRIDWMNVTCKLIEDAISSWARTVDRYGLSLIEAPIDEISSIPQRNPLRAPAVIIPCLAPPQAALCGLIGADAAASVDMSASFSAAVSKPDPLYYHKAILRKHGFVLDSEAAKNFPADVEVVFSWGKPTYKYSQYIHRSGVVFAQITDDGKFLLMANRLFTQRAGGGQHRYEKQTSDQYDGSRIYPANGPGAFSIGVGFGMGPPGGSGGCGSGGGGGGVWGSSGGGAGSHYAFPPQSFLPATAATALGGGGGGYVTPEIVKEELDRFCRDEEALRNFYDEVDHRAANLNVNISVTSATRCLDSGSIVVGSVASSVNSMGPPQQQQQQGKMFGNLGGEPFWLERAGSALGERSGGGPGDRSIPPTPLLGPLRGGEVMGTWSLAGGPTKAQSGVVANGRNSSRSGRSSIIEGFGEGEI